MRLSRRVFDAGVALMRFQGISPIAAIAAVLHDARTARRTNARLARSGVWQRRCQVGQKAVGTPGASLNLIVGYTPDGLNLRRHDRAAIVLELHTEPQVDAMLFEEAPP